ncbi:MAG TPA: hypothetical protein VK327_09940 [Candidatus Paceibacterota bacterium]|nr:hypothetical protein [Candidatus Paceibacterota bacterium]
MNKGTAARFHLGSHATVRRLLRELGDARPANVLSDLPIIKPPDLDIPLANERIATVGS